MEDELEDSLEGRCVKLAEDDGWFVRKVKWVGRRAAPDRVFIRRSRHVWIEFKKPGGGEVSGLQVKEHRRMKKAGAEIYVVDSIRQFCLILGIVGIVGVGRGRAT